MKKILLLCMAACLAFAAPSFAQWSKVKKPGNHSQNCNNRNDNRRHDANRRFSNHVPSKVTDAFYREYPHAKNVSWSKSRGIWTVSFKSGFFSSNQSVRYAANGRRIEEEKNIFAKNKQRAYDWNRNR